VKPAPIGGVVAVAPERHGKRQSRATRIEPPPRGSKELMT
jgi:hypothetical protein